MDFSTGNSGNKLVYAVLKTGDGCRQEGAFCQYLGADVAPHVYALLDHGYAMEALQPASRYPGLLRDIEWLLEKKVWRRGALPISNEDRWAEELQKFGVQMPDYEVIGPSCLVHGDPTASNALTRMGSQLVLGDPRPPRAFIPQCKESDMGRILQSFLGWEVAAYGAHPMDFDLPRFMGDEVLHRAARFWCYAAAVRIKHLEMSRKPIMKTPILTWCDFVMEICSA